MSQRENGERGTNPTSGIAEPTNGCVTRRLIDSRAQFHGDRTFLTFETNENWSYADLRARVRSSGRALQDIGVKQDEPVLVWLPSGPLAIQAWLALSYIGAIFVPINLAYKGGILEHVVRDSGARLLIADSTLLTHLHAIDTAGLECVISVGGEGEAGNLQILPESVLRSALPPKDLQRELHDWDTHGVFYTSGTTGPSKGVLSSYRHIANALRGTHLTGEDERALVTLPMFHMGGPALIYNTLSSGGSAVVLPAFSTASFWRDVHDFQPTSVALMGAMATFLLQQPPSTLDRDHTLRTVTMVPLVERSEEFAERFGVNVITSYSLTEVPAPIISEVNPSVPGSCGVARGDIEIRLVDDHDFEVKSGEVGELVARSNSPRLLSHGYHNNPAETARAWRNGWFHTGDLLRRDSSGHFFFVDRKKDSIRRRGENISSFEVEREIGFHTDIREVAIIGIPSNHMEDEVMAVVSPLPGKIIDPSKLTEFLIERLPHFMVPRYIRVMDDLPKTSTQKVEKHRLRAEGVTPDTWDREVAGIRVTRGGLASRGAGALRKA